MLDDDRVLWADGPLWGGRRVVSKDEIDNRYDFYWSIYHLLSTGTGQVSLYDVSGDSEHYWLAEPPTDKDG